MCGIGGIVAAHATADHIESRLAPMLDALRHRGPDDEGRFVDLEGAVGLVHARLSILDLSPAGRQPMSDPTGRYTIVFNGEIYNFGELRGEMDREGWAFRSRTDTEVILALYQKLGQRCVERLRGMYAFAIWDQTDRVCFMARDPFGIKPLYYHKAAGRLVFASEIRALQASGLVPGKLDPVGLHGYLRTGSVPEPHTLLEGVRCLPAGHTAIWRDGRLETRRHWSLGFGSNTVAESVAVRTVRDALLDSVEHHFLSDVPVGVFLSGGIDSTAIVALARSVGRRELRSYSISFPGLAEDEGALARRTADHFGTQHQEWSIDAVIGRALFDRFLASMDQPSIDGLNTFSVSKLARDWGTKVVLSGLGGDELFGGYNSFRRVPQLARWSGRLRRMGPLHRRVSAMLRRAKRPPLRRLGAMLEQPPSLESAYSAFRGIFTAAEATVLTQHYTGKPVSEEVAAEELPDDPTPEDSVSRFELTRYMRNQLLRDSDVMSMAHGLELRVPFVDREVVEAVTRIPAAMRLRAGKQLLLTAVPEVPHWIADQPKRGFMFPFERWLSSEWGDVFAEIDRTCPVPTQTWYRKWAVFVLEQWIAGRTAGGGRTTGRQDH